MQEQEAVCLVDKVIDSSHPDRGALLDFRDLLEYVHKCYSTDTPTYEKNIMDLARLYLICDRHVSEDAKLVFQSVFHGVTDYLRSLGYRDDIFTNQENGLACGNTDKYDHNPYMPIGLLEGKMSLGEARKARRLALYTDAYRRFFVAPDFLWKGQLNILPVVLSPLDRDGRTCFDPYPLDIKLNPDKEWKKGRNFPFAREE